MALSPFQLTNWRWLLCLPTWLASATFLLTALALSTTASAASITIACGAVGQDFDFCKREATQWAQKTGNEIKFLSEPGNSSDVLALFRQMFAAKSSDLDVLNVDVVWPGVLKDHLLDLHPYTHGVEKQHFPQLIRNNTLVGKLVAMPWYTDAGMLYYRKDLLQKYGLKPPETWDDLSAAAKKIQEGERQGGKSDFQGFVFQAKAYEGLTCNALEWLQSFGGGEVVDASGRVTVNNPNAVRALETAASWINTIAPQGVLNDTEEEVRGVFQGGSAAFMRNWPYAWSLVNGADSPVKGKVGVMPLPKGNEQGRHAATLGGWQLAVSKYSKHPEEAAALVMYLSSEAVQKERAIDGAYNPTIPSLYQDKDVLEANPFFADLQEVLANATPRPSTVTALKYPEVSAAFWNAVHEVLSGQAKAADSLKKLEGRLNQIKRNHW